MSSITKQYLDSYAPGKKLVEIGCGSGDDANQLFEWGADYLGLDISDSAIRETTKLSAPENIKFISVDFFQWKVDSLFDVVYDKGFFHGLSGYKERKRFTCRVAKLLRQNGIWITVCGSADRKRKDINHGAIYLRDLIEPVEYYFEILEIKKAKYGLLNKNYDFNAWYAVFRCR